MRILRDLCFSRRSVAVAVVLVVAACQRTARPPVDEPAMQRPSGAVETASQNSHPVGQGDDAGPGPDAETGGNEGVHHTDDQHSGDHIKHMNDVREMLKWRLGAAYEAPLLAVSAGDLATGKQLYAKHCAKCHGPAGRGDGPAAKDLESPPSDHTDAEHASYYSDNGRLWIVRNGIPRTTMPGFLDELGERGTLQVYAYARSLASGPQKPDAHQHGHGHGHDHAHSH